MIQSLQLSLKTLGFNLSKGKIQNGMFQSKGEIYRKQDGVQNPYDPHRMGEQMP
jgi:hypothetical protein